MKKLMDELVKTLEKNLAGHMDGKDIFEKIKAGYERVINEYGRDDLVEDIQLSISNPDVKYVITKNNFANSYLYEFQLGEYLKHDKFDVKCFLIGYNELHINIELSENEKRRIEHRNVMAGDEKAWYSTIHSADNLRSAKIVITLNNQDNDYRFSCADINNQTPIMIEPDGTLLVLIRGYEFNFEHPIKITHVDGNLRNNISRHNF